MSNCPNRMWSTTFEFLFSLRHSLQTNIRNPDPVAQPLKQCRCRLCINTKNAWPEWVGWVGSSYGWTYFSIYFHFSIRNRAHTWTIYVYRVKHIPIYSCGRKAHLCQCFPFYCNETLGLVDVELGHSRNGTRRKSDIDGKIFRKETKTLPSTRPTLFQTWWTRLRIFSLFLFGRCRMRGTRHVRILHNSLDETETNKKCTEKCSNEWLIKNSLNLWECAVKKQRWNTLLVLCCVYYPPQSALPYDIRNTLGPNVHVFASYKPGRSISLAEKCVYAIALSTSHSGCMSPNDQKYTMHVFCAGVGVACSEMIS